MICGMALWTYGDWQEATDAATRLTNLRRHITEVREHTVGVKTRTGAAHFPVDVKYIESLERQEQTLTARVENAGKSVARSHGVFRR